jgi:hypothetical protein
MTEKICPFMRIWRAAIEQGDTEVFSEQCIKENCEFWTKRKNHYKQQNEYGCALVLSVQQKTF